jgi:hypothetical protein
MNERTAMEDPQACAEDGLTRAVCCGALLVPKPRTGEFSAMLRECNWRRAGRSVCSYAGSSRASAAAGGGSSTEPDTMALHVSNVAAELLDKAAAGNAAGDAIPQQVGDLAPRRLCH